jgi:hypothetical protein
MAFSAEKRAKIDAPASHQLPSEHCRIPFKPVAILTENFLSHRLFLVKLAA